MQKIACIEIEPGSDSESDNDDQNALTIKSLVT